MAIEIKLRTIVIFTVMLALAFAGVMIKMITENNQCVEQPFTYSAIALKESGGDYSCSCLSNNASLLDFTFNEEGITIINPKAYDSINYSNIEINIKRG